MAFAQAMATVIEEPYCSPQPASALCLSRLERAVTLHLLHVRRALNERCDCASQQTAQPSCPSGDYQPRFLSVICARQFETRPHIATLIDIGKHLARLSQTSESPHQGVFRCLQRFYAYFSLGISADLHILLRFQDAGLRSSHQSREERAFLFLLDQLKQ